MTEQEQQGPDFAKSTPGQASGGTPDNDIPPANELPGQGGQASGGTPVNDIRGQVRPEVLKSAIKAFKKRLKLTALDADSSVGRGPFSGGPKGVYAIQAPSQFPREVWEELCRQGKLRDSGHGMYELAKGEAG